jgi:TATA-box binding protein (TBP) (component of TFIID and TFIIIB)
MSIISNENLYDLNDNDDLDNYEKLDLKIINFIKMINNKETEKIPEPKYFTISTQSAMCNISNIDSIDLSKTVVHIARNIIKNIVLKENLNYLIRGIVVDNIIIRFDESYLKKYKKPFIKYLGNTIDPNNVQDCLLMLSSIEQLENNSLKKHGRQKKKKDNENFYNSCSIIVKGALNIKCVNIKLFNNGKITLTGSKEEFDGYKSCVVLLEEMKKNKNIFLNIGENDIDTLKIMNYKITMINSDFDTNFKIDLLKLLDILNNNEKDLFTKFNPEKYRGLIIGFYWNTNKKIQDGKCICKSKCNGKGNGTGDGQCKKITISVFKSGSIIITGGRLVKQIDDAYKKINSILKEHYHSIIKLSILDYIDDIDQLDDGSETDSNFDNTELNICEDKKPLKVQTTKKIIKIKKILK